MTLIIEDKKPDQFILKNILYKLKWTREEILIAHTGAEAMRVFSSNIDIIDLVICDFELPDGNSIGLLKFIKESKPEIVFIICSISKQPKLIFPYLFDLGLDYFMSKPINVPKSISFFIHIRKELQNLKDPKK